MAIAVAVFVATAIGTALFRRLAIARGWVALANERSSHQGAIPVGAGLVVLAASLSGVWLIETLGLAPSAVEGGFVAGAVLLGAVSWADDLYSLPIAVRLAAQVLAAVALLASFGRLGSLSVAWPLLGTVSFEVFTWPLLVLWVVAVINAYNFMDGIDGMAGLQAVVAGAAWYYLGARFGSLGLAQLGLVVAAASAGFLLHNLSKRRVFLGDVGSVFLGYSCAAMPVTASLANPGGPLLVSGALVLWPFLFDTAFTLLRRWRRGEPLAQAHRDHLYQRLVKGGISHARVSLVYAAFSVIGAVAGVLILFQSRLFDAVALGSLLSLSLLLCSWVRRVEQRSRVQGTATPPKAP